MTDLINHPPHYIASDGLEVIDIIERYDLGYHLGNAIAYLIRAGRKVGSPIDADLGKARWYVDRWMRRNIDGYEEEPCPEGEPMVWRTPESIVEAFGLSGPLGEAVEYICGMAVYDYDESVPQLMRRVLDLIDEAASQMTVQAA